MAVGTIEDITEHEVLEDQLRQSSKMEALGRLAGGVAHDFNNILTVVNGYADLLVLSLEGDERAAEALEIKKAGAHATELTAQLLAFGRRSKRALESVDLNDRIEAMVPMLRRLLGEDIEFTVSLDQALGAVEADPSQLDQLVMNLVVNGRDAMPSGGSLGITTSRLGSGVTPARGWSNGWAMLEIADSGFGMEPEVLEHIFEPFFTTKGQGKGTGLGLATVYGIVQQMGGHIRVESTLGRGSTFVVELPLRESAFDSSNHVVAGSVSADFGTETVLVVEDEPAVRDLCKMALTAKGYQVHVAGPHDALGIADSLGSGLDILVTDVVMPGIDGPTIAAALRSKRPDLKVLFMSGYPLDREDDLTGAAGEGSVLGKPFVPRELCDAVRRVLDRPVSGS
jgi:nitrogen-specific signal transduction histidine kinase